MERIRSAERFIISMSILIHFFTLALVIPFFGLAASVPPISTNSSTCAYASVNHINTVFGYFTEGNYPGFFRYVVDDVDWDIQGTHPLAGHYMNKTIFAMNTIVRLAKVQDYSAPHSTTLQNIVGGCDEPWSVQELQVIATFKNGIPIPLPPYDDYGLIYLKKDSISIIPMRGLRGGTSKV
jgi:hypothetical protein